MTTRQKASLAKAGKQWVKYKESADNAIAEGNYELSESVLFAALTEAQDIFDKTDFRYIYTLEKLAQSLWFLGRFEDAMEYSQKLYDIHLSNINTLDAIARLTYTIDLALLQHATQRTEEAKKTYNEALIQCSPIFGDNHTCTNKLKSLLADLLNSSGDLQKAQQLGVNPTAITSNDWLSAETLKSIKGAGGAPGPVLEQEEQSSARVALPPKEETDPGSASFMPPPPPSKVPLKKPRVKKQKIIKVQERTDLPNVTPLDPQEYSKSTKEFEGTPVPLLQSEAETIYFSNDHTAKETLEAGDAEKANHLYTINLKLLNFFDFENSKKLETLHNLLTAKQKLGLIDDALEIAPQILELKTQELGEFHLDIAHAANELAGIFYGAASYGEAINLTQKCIDIYRHNHGEEHESIASSLHNLATLYHVQRDYDKAEDTYKKCLKLKQKLFGNEHPSTSRLLKSYAVLLKETHREDEANHMSEMAAGMITGSWKALPELAESEKLTAVPEEPDSRLIDCEVCNAPMEGKTICPACAHQPNLDQ